MTTFDRDEVEDENTAAILDYFRSLATSAKVRNDHDALELVKMIASGPSLQGHPVLRDLFHSDSYPLEELVVDIPWISRALSMACPEYFLPYKFSDAFHVVEDIARTFDIPIPPLPGKRDLSGRITYYGLINQSWQEFRRTHHLDPAEMHAFLYDFAPKVTWTESEDLPSPSKVWLLMGSVGGSEDYEWLEQAGDDDQSPWQGNIETRRGDVLVMYCVSPYKRIHSIWRAVSDGFIDPFSWYHSRVRIGHPIKTPPITFGEIKAHATLSQNRYVRAHFQGASGKPFTVAEYDAILAMMAAKGFDISKLPRPQGLPQLPESKARDERDVEETLVEPLLQQLDYIPDDWVRQLPVRMGRGQRIYPDYAFFPTLTRGEETASMILEAKYRITGERELASAYYQAKSYALRLQAQSVVIAALDGIWVFLRRKESFALDERTHYSWRDLQNPDTLHRLRAQIGRDNGRLRRQSRR